MLVLTGALDPMNARFDEEAHALVRIESAAIATADAWNDCTASTCREILVEGEDQQMVRVRIIEYQ